MNLKELSKLLDLSPTTVSRALNGFPEVNADTRKRVAEAAALHNYRPNSRAKALRTGRSFSIGHIVPLTTRSDMVNPIFADFIASAGEEFSRRGYFLTLSVVQDDEQEQAYRNMATNGTVEGFIVHGVRRNDTRIDMLQSLGLPFAVHGRGAHAVADYSWVDINNKGAFKRATTYLIELGHTRIALINGVETMDFAARRRKGFEEALRAHGLEPDPDLMKSDDMTEVSGYEFARELAGRANPPTAYLTSSMLLAIGVKRALRERGLELGRDVSVITHNDDLSYLKNAGELPMFTATQSSIRLAGLRCAQMLLDQIEGKSDGFEHELLEPDFIPGASTGPAPDL